MKRLFRTVKWVVIAPIFLFITYAVGIFSELVRAAVITGIHDNLQIIGWELESKKLGSDK